MSSSQAPNPKPAGQTPHLLPGSVLVAEDEHLIATDLAHSLGQLGVSTIGPVANGRDAIAAAKAQHPDMALLDIRMPVMDGLEAAGVLGQQMGVPVVIVSAYSDQSLVQAAAKVGAFGYLLKPTTTERLRAALAVAWVRYLDHIGLRDQVHQLKTRLADRRDIEAAKGVIMDRLGISESDALQRLRRKARDTRRSMADLARAILQTQNMLLD
jgi:two-component system, response regulator PdtaR